MISMFLKPPDDSREWNIEASGDVDGSIEVLICVGGAACPGD
jgi:hypothetical protein